MTGSAATEEVEGSGVAIAEERGAVPDGKERAEVGDMWVVMF